MLEAFLSLNYISCMQLLQPEIYFVKKIIQHKNYRKNIIVNIASGCFETKFKVLIQLLCILTSKLGASNAICLSKSQCLSFSDVFISFSVKKMKWVGNQFQYSRNICRWLPLSVSKSSLLLRFKIPVYLHVAGLVRITGIFYLQEVLFFISCFLTEKRCRNTKS